MKALKVIEVVGVPDFFNDFMSAIGQLMLTPSGKRGPQRMAFIEGVVELRNYTRFKISVNAKKVTIKCYNGAILAVEVQVRRPIELLQEPTILLRHDKSL